MVRGLAPAVEIARHFAERRGSDRRASGSAERRESEGPARVLVPADPPVRMGEGFLHLLRDLSLGSRLRVLPGRR